MFCRRSPLQNPIDRNPLPSSLQPCSSSSSSESACFQTGHRPTRLATFPPLARPASSKFCLTAVTAFREPAAPGLVTEQTQGTLLPIFRCSVSLLPLDASTTPWVRLLIFPSDSSCATSTLHFAAVKGHTGGIYAAPPFATRLRVWGKRTQRRTRQTHEPEWTTPDCHRLLLATRVNDSSYRQEQTTPVNDKGPRQKSTTLVNDAHTTCHDTRTEDMTGREETNVIRDDTT